MHTHTIKASYGDGDRAQLDVASTSVCDSTQSTPLIKTSWCLLAVVHCSPHTHTHTRVME